MNDFFETDDVIDEEVVFSHHITAEKQGNRRATKIKYWRNDRNYNTGHFIWVDKKWSKKMLHKYNRRNTEIPAENYYKNTYKMSTLCWALT